MRLSMIWPVIGLAAASAGTVVFIGCPEEQEPPPMTQGVTEKEHEPFFPIGPTAHHRLGQAVVGMEDDMSCSSCHGGTATFAEFTCLNCHARNDTVEGALDLAHASAFGFTKVDASCYSCHPTGEATPRAAEGEGEGEGEPFDHQTDAFPVPHGNGVGCDECHIAPYETPPDYGTLCADCHLDPGHSININEAHSDPNRLSEVFEDNRDETGCRECHPSTPAFDMADHDATMFPGHSLLPVCKDCHRYFLPEPKEWGIDFTRTGCTPDASGTTTGCHPSEPNCSASNRDDC